MWYCSCHYTYNPTVYHSNVIAAVPTVIQYTQHQYTNVTAELPTVIQYTQH
jgi:hypothetical protein